MAYLSRLAFFSPAGVCQPAQITWLHLPPGYSPGNVECQALILSAVGNLRDDALQHPIFWLEKLEQILCGAWRAVWVTPSCSGIEHPISHRLSAAEG